MEKVSCINWFGNDQRLHQSGHEKGSKDLEDVYRHYHAPELFRTILNMNSKPQRLFLLLKNSGKLERLNWTCFSQFLFDLKEKDFIFETSSLISMTT
jgi:hypothetical protein